MTWFSGIHIVTVLFSIQTVYSRTRDGLDRGSYQCHCSCSSPYNPDSIVMTTAKLRRQGHMLTMDSVSIQESNNYIKNLLGSVYEKLVRTLSDMDRNQLDKLQQSLQVQNGGKMPKDMAVTVVDLFKKALYPDDNNIANRKHVTVPEFPKSTFTNSNGFVTDKLQVVLDKQKVNLKQWQKTEENIKQAHKKQQQNRNLSKAKTPVETQTTPKAYTLRTLNTLIKSATERLAELYGKAKAKEQQNPSLLGPTQPPVNQQAFRNERVTIDETVRGKPYSSYKSDNHGFWTQETGSIVGIKSKERNGKHGIPTSNSDIGPRSNVPLEINRTPLTNIITGQPNLNGNINSVHGIPLSNPKNGQNDINTNFKKADSLSVSNTNDNGQVIGNTNSDKSSLQPLSKNNIGQAIVKTNSDKITRVPLSDNNINSQAIVNTNSGKITRLPLYNKNNDAQAISNTNFEKSSRQRLSDNINGQTIVNTNSGKITRLPLYNNNNDAQAIANTNFEKSSRQRLSDNNINGQTIVNTNSGKITRLPLYNNNNDAQAIANTNFEKSSRQRLSDNNNAQAIINTNSEKSSRQRLSNNNNGQPIIKTNVDKSSRQRLSENNNNGQVIVNTKSDIISHQRLSDNIINNNNGQPIVNTRFDKGQLPVSNNNNNGQKGVITNSDKITRLPLSTVNNGQTSVNTNSDNINRLPLSNSNIGPAYINTNSKNSNTANTQSLNNNKKVNATLAPYEVPPSNPTKPTMFVTVEPNPSSIAYYKPNVMSSETVKSDPVGAINNYAGSNIDVKSMLDFSVSRKVSNVGPPTSSEQVNKLTKQMPTGSYTTVNSILDDALFQKISNASPVTRSLFTDAILKQIPNGNHAPKTKSTNTLIKNNDVSSPKQGRKSIQMSPQTGGGNTEAVADIKQQQQQQIHVNVDVTKQPPSGIDVLDGMFGNQIGKTSPVNVNPIGLALPEQTIQNPLSNEWDVLLKQTPQPYEPPSNIQPQNFRNSAQDIMSVTDLFKLLSNLSNNNQQLDNTQYMHRSTTAANNDLAMAMMFGAWKK